MSYIDKLAWLHVVDRKVLSTRSKGKDAYYIPGGKREAGESDIEALVREIKEELSVDLHGQELVHFGTFEGQAHGKPEGTMVRMTCYMGPYEGEIAAAAEIDEVVWIGHSGKAASSPTDGLILDALRDAGLID